MDSKFSLEVREIMNYSHNEAVRLGNPYIGLEHLFLGIVSNKESNAVQILKKLNLDIEVFKQKLEASVKINNTLNQVDNLPLTKQTERALKFTYILAKEFNKDMAILCSQYFTTITTWCRNALNTKE